MSAIATLAPTSLCNKLSNLPFAYTPIPIQIPTLFPSKPKPHTAFALKTHFSSFSLLSLPLFRTPASASFDGFESEKDSEQEDPESEEYEEEDEQRVSNSAEDGRLYVGNLPYSMNSAQLGDVFSEAGRVVKVEVVYDRVTDRSRGFGFVTMSSVEEAKQAIRMLDGSQVGGRTVKVNFPEVPRGGEREVMGPKIRRSDQGFVDSPHKIYAGNLGWGLSSQSLRDAFAGQPGLLSAKVIYDRNSGRSRGFGFVTFESADDVESALEAMNGVEVEGRPLRLNVAAERAPLSPPSLGSSAENNLDSSELLSSIST